MCSSVSSIVGLHMQHKILILENGKFCLPCCQQFWPGEPLTFLKFVSFILPDFWILPCNSHPCSAFRANEKVLNLPRKFLCCTETLFRAWPEDGRPWWCFICWGLKFFEREVLIFPMDTATWSRGVSVKPYSQHGQHACLWIALTSAALSQHATRSLVVL